MTVIPLDEGSNMLIIDVISKISDVAHYFTPNRNPNKSEQSHHLEADWKWPFDLRYLKVTT